MGRLAGAAAAAAWLLAGGAAQAVPRFALRTGTTCITCHVNPSGGGMRNSYGRDVFALTRLVAVPGDAPPPSPGNAPPLAVGTDMRFAHLGVWPGPDDTGAHGYTGTFFPMQADVYMTASQGPLTALVDYGLLGSWEATMMATLGPFTVKAGRFMVPFGLRLDNHTVYTREGLGFGAREKDVGVEVGGTWMWPRLQLHVQASGTNGAGGEVLLDDNKDKATTARVELFVRPLAQPRGRTFNLMAGASGYRNVTGVATADKEQRTVHDRLGVFGGVALGRFTLLGESVIAVDDDLGAAPAKDGRLERIARFVELGAIVRRGLEAQVMYEFLDPDVNVTPNARHRVGLMIDVFPVPWFAVHAMVRIVDAPAFTPDRGRVESMLQLHLYL